MKYNMSDNTNQTLHTPTKEERRGMAIIICFTVLSGLFFCPFDAYIANSDSFFVSIYNVVLNLLCIAVAASAIVFGVGLILRPKARRIFIPAVFSVGICTYSQYYFLNAKFSIFDGTDINWSSYANYDLPNTLIWIGVMIVFVVLYCRVEKFKSFLKHVSLLLLIVQTITAATLCFTYKDKPAYLSVDDVYEIGDQKNVIYIVADTLDVGYIEYLIESENERLDFLDGFTFFKNMTTAYSKTYASVPFMLTNQYYLNEKVYTDFLNETLPRSPLLNELKTHDFKIGVYTTSSVLNAECLTGLVDNVKNGTAINLSLDLSSVEEVLTLSLFKTMPHVLKKYINLNPIYNISSQSDEYTFDDPKFYQHISGEDLQVLHNKNVFKMIHLNGMHAPYLMDEDANYSENSTAYQQLLGILKILNKTMTDIKEKGQYDNSIIVVVGDHGAILGNQPAFLIKPFNAVGSLKVSSAPVQLQDIQTTLLQELGYSALDTGEDVFSVEEDDARTRLYYDYRINDPAEMGYLPAMWEMIYEHDSIIPAFTQKIFSNGKAYSSYEYAEVIEPNKEITKDDMRPYFNSNFLSWGAEDWIFISGMKGLMLFKLDNLPPAGVQVRLDWIDWVEKSPLTITIDSIDGQNLLAYEYHTDGTTPSEVTFAIPADCFHSNAVVLEVTFSENVGYFTPEHQDLRRKQIALQSISVITK